MGELVECRAPVVVRDDPLRFEASLWLPSVQFLLASAAEASGELHFQIRRLQGCPACPWATQSVRLPVLLGTQGVMALGNRYLCFRCWGCQFECKWLLIAGVTSRSSQRTNSTADIDHFCIVHLLRLSPSNHDFLPNSNLTPLDCARLNQRGCPLGSSISSRNEDLLHLDRLEFLNRVGVYYRPQA